MVKKKKECNQECRSSSLGWKLVVANNGSLIAAEAGLDLGGGTEGGHERGLGVRGRLGGGWDRGWRKVVMVGR